MQGISVAVLLGEIEVVSFYSARINFPLHSPRLLREKRAEKVPDI